MSRAVHPAPPPPVPDDPPGPNDLPEPDENPVPNAPLPRAATIPTLSGNRSTLDQLTVEGVRVRLGWRLLVQAVALHGWAHRRHVQALRDRRLSRRASRSASGLALDPRMSPKGKSYPHPMVAEMVDLLKGEEPDAARHAVMSLNGLCRTAHSTGREVIVQYSAELISPLVRQLSTRRSKDAAMVREAACFLLRMLALSQTMSDDDKGIETADARVNQLSICEAGAAVPLVQMLRAGSSPEREGAVELLTVLATAEETRASLLAVPEIGDGLKGLLSGPAGGSRSRAVLCIRRLASGAKLAEGAAAEQGATATGHGHYVKLHVCIPPLVRLLKPSGLCKPDERALVLEALGALGGTSEQARLIMWSTCGRAHARARVRAPCRCPCPCPSPCAMPSPTRAPVPVLMAAPSCLQAGGTAVSGDGRRERDGGDAERWPQAATDGAACAACALPRRR